MSKAFIDTTVFTDALLKTGEIKINANQALKKFDITELPVFAIKEFKAGPLNNFVWMYNKLVILNSYQKALDALHGMSRTPKHYTTSTAIEALKESVGSISKQTPDTYSKKYGEYASMDKILCDECRLSLRTIIIKSWKKRRKITTNVVYPLYCYHEVPPYEKRRLIELDPKICDSAQECSLAPVLRSNIVNLKKMREAIRTSQKKEDQNRFKALSEICRNPSIPIREKNCKYLGDAIFVLLAPEDAIILTTNIVDYKPLAEALGKSVKRPEDI